MAASIFIKTAVAFYCRAWRCRVACGRKAGQTATSRLAAVRPVTEPTAPTARSPCIQSVASTSGSPIPSRPAIPPWRRRGPVPASCLKSVPRRCNQICTMPGASWRYVRYRWSISQRRTPSSATLTVGVESAFVAAPVVVEVVPKCRKTLNHQGLQVSFVSLEQLRNPQGWNCGTTGTGIRFPSRSSGTTAIKHLKQQPVLTSAAVGYLFIGFLGDGGTRNTMSFGGGVRGPENDI